MQPIGRCITPSYFSIRGLERLCYIWGDQPVHKLIPSQPMPKRKTTVTSTFGSPGRDGHDSSAFYGTRLYAGRSPAGNNGNDAYVENPVGALDVIHHASCEEGGCLLAGASGYVLKDVAGAELVIAVRSLL